MKVLITGHTPLEGQDWWYIRHQGKVFEVDEGSLCHEHERYIVTDKHPEFEGFSILKQDCKIVEL